MPHPSTSPSQGNSSRPEREAVNQFIRDAWETTGVIHPTCIPTSTEYAIAEYALMQIAKAG